MGRVAVGGKRKYGTALTGQKKENFLKRVILTLTGIFAMGISLSVLKIVDWGLDSFTYMNVSVSEKIGWSLGNWQLLLNVFLFLPVIMWGRKYLGLGTVFNMVLVGYTVDFGTWIWEKTELVQLPETLWVRIPVMVFTLVIFIFAVAVYMSTGLGASPFDALPKMLAERFPRVPFAIIRFLWDFTAVAVGFLMSRKVGIVTILMIFFLGKTISFVQEKVDKILE